MKYLPINLQRLTLELPWNTLAYNFENSMWLSVGMKYLPHDLKSLSFKLEDNPLGTNS